MAMARRRMLRKIFYHEHNPNCGTYIAEYMLIFVNFIVWRVNVI